MKYIGLVLAALGVIFMMGRTIYDKGAAAGTANFQAQTAAASATALQTTQTIAAQQTQATLDRAQSTGRKQETARVRINTFFEELDRQAKELSHETVPTTTERSIDSCVLPADRLRLWQAANRGSNLTDSSNQGSPAREFDASAASVATTRLRANSGLGIKPQGGGEGVSPARIPDVPTLGVPANTRARELQ